MFFDPVVGAFVNFTYDKETVNGSTERILELQFEQEKTCLLGFAKTDRANDIGINTSNYSIIFLFVKVVNGVLVIEPPGIFDTMFVVNLPVVYTASSAGNVLYIDVTGVVGADMKHTITKIFDSRTMV